MFYTDLCDVTKAKPAFLIPVVAELRPRFGTHGFKNLISFQHIPLRRCANPICMSWRDSATQALHHVTKKARERMHLWIALPKNLVHLMRICTWMTLTFPFNLANTFFFLVTCLWKHSLHRAHWHFETNKVTPLCSFLRHLQIALISVWCRKMARGEW